MKQVIFIFALAVAFLLGSVCVVQHRMLSRSLGESDSLRQQLEATRREASQVAKQSAAPGDGLAQSQFSELLKLRSEVTQLREETNAMEKLREENDELQARTIVSDDAAANTNSEAGQEIHQKESWAFAGYDTPENSFQSLLWAFAQTNKEAFLGGVDSNSETYASLMKDGDFERHVADESSKIKSFRFAGPSKMFGGFSVVSVYVEDGSDPGTETHDILFKKNGDSWQIVGAH